MISLHQQHIKKWDDCKLCTLCETRNKMVFARGQVPCDVLFVGEAPGESENVLGRPFVGPAGQLLDVIIRKALPDTMKIALTNLVCCIPRDADGSKTSEPEDVSIIACSERLKEFVKIADPKLLVAVGTLARDWLTPGYKYSIKIHKTIRLIDIVHPAAILRANVAQRGMAIQRAVVKLATAVDDLFKED